MDLNIVTLNIPYPPDYGAMIGSFYRIKWLKAEGIRIHLHCFEYGRRPAEELESLCEAVNYYSRNTTLLNQFSKIPYIVKSRTSIDLLENLKTNDFPILFDGLHTTYFLNHPDLKTRKKLVRAHNIEHQYYKSLSNHELNPIKKLFYLIEYKKLKSYEKIIGESNFSLTVSPGDHEYFSRKYQNSVYITPFHPFEEIVSLPGRGGYILYHGDLSVAENSIIAESLIKNVFSKMPFNCIIAGKNPPPGIKTKASVNNNIRIISNPDTNEMEDLIRNAHINLLPSLTSNGFKMKLIFALFSGRHCLVNSVSAENLPDKSLFQIADTNEQLIDKINLLMNQEFTPEMINERKIIVEDKFSNQTNARKLIELAFS